jgi:hypothetical protein
LRVERFIEYAIGSQCIEAIYLIYVDIMRAYAISDAGVQTDVVDLNWKDKERYGAESIIQLSS